MSENLSQWDFVTLAYAIGIVGTLAIIGWSLAALKKAEWRKEKLRRDRRD